MKLDKLLPLISLADSIHAYKIGKTLVESGYNYAEVVFRTDAASEVIEEMSKVSGLTVGAGTVVNIEQVKFALNKGAKFIVSPGINHDVIKYCVDNNVPVFPGVITPSEIETCKSYGLSVLKLFPAGVFGGVKLLQALSGPFKDIKFVPTGGVNIDNFTDFLKEKNVVCVGGSFFIDNNLVKNEDWLGLKEHLERIRKTI